MNEDSEFSFEDKSPGAGQEPVLVSALEHYSYCPRQCALIHREQTFDENLYTLRGRAVHERVDEAGSELMDGVRVERGLPIWSERLGLVGRADVVEFHGQTPYPVEYKYGSVTAKGHADLQVCAQALCLEEMLGRPVPRGAVYHFSSRRRREVSFTPELREKVAMVVEAIRRMLQEERLPPAVDDRRCVNCSLRDSCLPAAVGRPRRLRSQYAALFTVEEDDDATDP